jgi:hypothetical protein
MEEGWDWRDRGGREGCEGKRIVRRGWEQAYGKRVSGVGKRGHGRPWKGTASERWVARPNKAGLREEQGKCELKGSRHGVRGKRTERGGNTKVSRDCGFAIKRNSRSKKR